jgi:hypothetical protein
MSSNNNNNNNNNAPTAPQPNPSKPPPPPPPSKAPPPAPLKPNAKAAPPMEPFDIVKLIQDRKRSAGLDDEAVGFVKWKPDFVEGTAHKAELCTLSAGYNKTLNPDHLWLTYESIFNFDNVRNNFPFTLAEPEFQFVVPTLERQTLHVFV